MAAAKPNSSRKRSGSKTVDETPSEQVQQNVCFTIMPFGGYFDEYYEEIYRPAIESAGLVPRRADDLFRPSTITNDIWIYTHQAKIILADLSDKNANVFYELGLAHALAKPAILITQSMDDIPFDLRALRVIVYDKNKTNWGEVLKEKLISSIAQTLSTPQDAILPAFLAIKPPVAAAKTLTESERQFLELRREVELLRNQMIAAGGSSRRFGQDFTLPPDDARKSIKNYIDAGLGLEQIMARLLPQGVPSGWIRTQYARFASSKSDDADGANGT